MTIYVEADNVSDVDDHRLAELIIGVPQVVAMEVDVDLEPIGEDANAIPSD